jgi:hypothetical protein
MRIALLGALIVGTGLAVAALGTTLSGGEAMAQRAGFDRASLAERGLIAFCEVVNDEYQQLTVIDPQRQVVSVYHVELATGDVELMCVRTIHWDLQMMSYNGKGLLPQEIHSLQEPR